MALNGHSFDYGRRLLDGRFPRAEDWRVSRTDLRFSVLSRLGNMASPPAAATTFVTVLWNVSGCPGRFSRVYRSEARLDGVGSGQ